MSNNITNKLLTVEDCCKLLGVTRATLQRFIKIGRFAKPLGLPYQRKYWKQSDIDNFFASSGVTADEDIKTPASAFEGCSATARSCTSGSGFADHVFKIIRDKRKQLDS